MTSALVAAWFVSVIEATTLVIVPPSTDQADQHGWGRAAADLLQERLLRHSVLNTGQRDYPIKVFGWQTAVAALADLDIDDQHLLTQREASALAQRLGADAVFHGAYWIKSQGVAMMWRVTPGGSAEKHRAAIDKDATSKGLSSIAEAIFAELKVAIGEPSTERAVEDVPFSALYHYGEALTLLRYERLMPWLRPRLRPEDLQAALEQLKGCVAIDPTFGRAWAYKSIVERMMGDDAASAASLLEAMKHSLPFSPALAHAQFLAEIDEGHPQKAFDALVQSVEAYGGNLDGMLDLGEAYLQYNDIHAAVRMFSRLSAYVLTNRRLALLHADALSRIGQSDLATVRLQPIYAKAPDDVELAVRLAQIYIDAKDYGRAGQQLQSAEQRFKGNPAVLAAQAELLLEKGDYAAGLALANRAVAQLPAAPKALSAYSMGYVKLVQGYAKALNANLDDALKDLAAADEMGLDSRARIIVLRDPKVQQLINHPRFPIRLHSQHAAPKHQH